MYEENVLQLRADLEIADKIAITAGSRTGLTTEYNLTITCHFSDGSVSHVVAASRRLVPHFHHSTVSIAGQKRKQVEQNPPNHKLIQYCRTRWN